MKTIIALMLMGASAIAGALDEPAQPAPFHMRMKKGHERDAYAEAKRANPGASEGQLRAMARAEARKRHAAEAPARAVSELQWEVEKLKRLTR